jgi:predicted nucleic acid-binding protein
MTTAAIPLRCVVDASVGIKLFLAEALSERADALFLHLAADPPAQIFVPDLFYIECANILWKHTRRSGFPVDKARKALADLGALALRRLPTAELMTGALDVAVQEAITAYDACYVALARRLSAPMVTADEKLARALGKASYDVHWLGEFPIPPVPASS